MELLLLDILTLNRHLKRATELLMSADLHVFRTATRQPKTTQQALLLKN